ncbi:MAG: hypothetical protein KI788_18700 [Mameliella sp.]|nr:hypothetical protein [Mameliella sp.]
MAEADQHQRRGCRIADKIGQAVPGHEPKAERRVHADVQEKTAKPDGTKDLLGLCGGQEIDHGKGAGQMGMGKDNIAILCRTPVWRE